MLAGEGFQQKNNMILTGCSTKKQCIEIQEETAASYSLLLSMLIVSMLVNFLAVTREPHLFPSICAFGSFSFARSRCLVPSAVEYMPASSPMVLDTLAASPSLVGRLLLPSSLLCDSDTLYTIGHSIKTAHSQMLVTWQTLSESLEFKLGLTR
jgi:hypothetical protein